MKPDPLVPEWQAPGWVRALSTTRQGGVSEGPWGLADGRAGGLNVGDACGDDPPAVASNRARLRELLPSAPAWLRQVHGREVFRVERAPRTNEPLPAADAMVTAVPECVLAIQTADCLPVLFADRRLPVVAAAHAGWRGLAGGVLEATIDAMCALGASPDSLLAWIGPGIGPRSFEVGDDVRAAFIGQDGEADACFVRLAEPGKWLADLPALAIRRLSAAGLATIVPSGLCTVEDPLRFYSYRRDGRCGRMVSLIWIAR